MNRKMCLTIACALLATSPLHAGVNDLAWLSGCWIADGAESGSIEQWTAPAGGSMLGVNRTIKDGKTSAFEFMRIIESDSELVFISSPSGQATASFTLTHQADRKVVFENPQHDFPQKIIYELTGSNALLGRIEGTINAAQRTVDFPMTRTRCETEASAA